MGSNSEPRLIRHLLSSSHSDHSSQSNITSESSSSCINYHTEDHSIEEAFEHIYYVMIFMACLWFVGKVFARCGLPSLVGEIVVGIILGPNLLNFVPYSDALIVIGEIGLVLLVLEAGIDVSVGHLKVVGSRGLLVAIFGSLIPLGIGTGLAIGYGITSIQESISIGACLAPTSMGIALNVLRNAKVLNTPTGQLIIAAAVLDDVIALMLLSELEAMAHPSIKSILLPLIVSPLFIIFFGLLAIKCTPWLIQKIMIRTKKQQHENVILLLLFTATFIMIPVCFYCGSSHLLGAFLAGLMFCTDHTIHEAWNNQIKRIMQWMLRVFFACTIGFAVPIQDFWSKPVIVGGLLYFIAIIGKILTGIFAKPLTISEFFTIAFSMSAWGEFAFILAAASFSSGTISKDSYSSVLMAVLLSVVISPLCLRATLSIARKSKEKYLTNARDAHYDFDIDSHNNGDDNHPVYFCIHTKGKGKWGHQDKLLHCIFGLNLEIIDFRAFNEAEYNYSHHLPIVQDVFYVLDKTLLLPPTKRLGKLDEKKLQTRYKEIKRNLKQIMGDPHANIDVMRWLPGVRKTDDLQSPTKQTKQSTKTNNNKTKTVSYCRKEAYKQARLALDNEARRSSSYLVSGISRIRPSHDNLYRDKFTYHGGIHTEQDDLIAMAFIDTLTSLHESLSPANRSSPTGSNEKEPLNTEELFAKISTLKNCVGHLPIFQPALSDDGKSSIRGNTTIRYGENTFAPSYSNPPSIHSVDQINHTTFDGIYKATFAPLQQPNISAESLNEIPRTNTAEHGKIAAIEHTRSMVNSTDKPIPPGMFTSHSHGLLPSTQHMLHHHPSGHHHYPYHSHHFNHLPRDVYPRDVLHGLPSQSHGSDHHPLHISSEESSSNNSDDLHCDTMYGDEDEHHRPLAGYTNLDDLEEEEEELNNNDKQPQQHKLEQEQEQEEKKDSQQNNSTIKRSTTWSKLNTIFRTRKLSDDESDDQNRKKMKRNKKKHKEKDSNGYDNISVSSHRNLSWDPEDEQDTVSVDPKMLEIPQSLLKNKNKNKNKNIDQENTKQNENEIKKSLHSETNVAPSKITKSNHNKRSPPRSTKREKQKHNKSKRPQHIKVASYSNLSRFDLEEDENEKLPLKALKNQ